MPAPVYPNAQQALHHPVKQAAAVADRETSTPEQPSAKKEAPTHIFPHTNNAAEQAPAPASEPVPEADAPPLHRARAYYARAARAFLQRNYLSALALSEDARAALSPLPSSNTATGSSDRARLTERLAVLRLTLYATSYASRSDILASVSTALSHAELVQARLSLSPREFAAALWMDTLEAFSPTSFTPDQQLAYKVQPAKVEASLDPTPKTLSAALALPPGVLAAAILAALRLDEPGTGAGAGTSQPSLPPVGGAEGSRAARAICEWFLAAHASASATAAGQAQAQVQAYKRVVELYAVHVLGARSAEWEYAREFAGYSALEPREREVSLRIQKVLQRATWLPRLCFVRLTMLQMKLRVAPTFCEETNLLLLFLLFSQSLLAQIDAAQAHIESAPERARQAALIAQRTYETERARRAAAEKEARNAAGGSGGGMMRGVADFLRGSGGPEEASKNASLKEKEAGQRSPPQSRPSRGGSASQRTSSSPSPAQDGAPRSSSRSSTGRSERSRKGRSGTDSSAYSDASASGSGEGSSTTAKTSRSSKERPGLGTQRSSSSGASAGAAEEVKEGSYASLRGSVSNYLDAHPLDKKNSVGSSSTASTTGVSASASATKEKDQPRALSTRPQASALGLLSYARDALFKSYTGRWLSSTMLVLLLFLSLKRRGALGSPSSSSSVLPFQNGQGAAATRARARLNAHQRPGAVNGGAIRWAWTLWRNGVGKVWDTVRMGTQVTYL